MPRKTTAAKAREAGLTRYYTGKPCKHGHVAERLISNWCCVVCSNIKSKRTINERQRRYSQTTKGKVAIQKKRKSKGQIAQHQRYLQQNPTKVAARKAAQHAKKKGKLIAKPCWCGDKQVEAHHPNYRKPLNVIWLCAAHHQEIHRAR